MRPCFVPFGKRRCSSLRPTPPWWRANLSLQRLSAVFRERLPLCHAVRSLPWDIAFPPQRDSPEWPFQKIWWTTLDRRAGHRRAGPPLPCYFLSPLPLACRGLLSSAAEIAPRKDGAPCRACFSSRWDYSHAGRACRGGPTPLPFLASVVRL